MKISIVVPSFNQKKYIGRTIESILSQEGDFRIECIVFDGGSTDGTVEILKEFSKKINDGAYQDKSQGVDFFWVSKKDKGQSDAINQGLKKASGDILAYLNSDDVYIEGSFQKIVDAFGAGSKEMWLTGFCGIIDGQDRKTRNIIAGYKNFWLRHYSYNKLLVLNFISQPATFWKRDVHGKGGYFNENMHYAMDYDFWLRIGKNYRPIILDSELADFRVHKESKGETTYKKQFAEDFEISKKYSKNKILNLLHQIHNFLIVSIYKLIK